MVIQRRGRRLFIVEQGYDFDGGFDDGFVASVEGFGGLLADGLEVEEREVEGGDLRQHRLDTLGDAIDFAAHKG